MTSCRACMSLSTEQSTAPLSPGPILYVHNTQHSGHFSRWQSYGCRMVHSAHSSSNNQERIHRVRSVREGPWRRAKRHDRTEFHDIPASIKHPRTNHQPNPPKVMWVPETKKYVRRVLSIANVETIQQTPSKRRGILRCSLARQPLGLREMSSSDAPAGVRVCTPSGDQIAVTKVRVPSLGMHVGPGLSLRLKSGKRHAHTLPSTLDARRD
ncbi:uncharacterized protein EI90DRAFT_3074506 [Cantharellus anzutake]|uniref:uncharacterized protein n=1 Tax=Cantharellus anzutake TaxID=1750568 RepID=UPI0019032BFE|nr:uncharacterized protein EI90DRAFT_3074506 [Cantharellus anzutake]KAF8324929.1 hypothetical protein EI90DRAFT_3074506 [Cantharellus anzutake]